MITALALLGGLALATAPLSGGLYWVRMTGRIYDATHPLEGAHPRPGDLPPAQVQELEPCRRIIGLTSSGPLSRMDPGDDPSRTYLIPPEAAGYPQGDRPLVIGLGPAPTSFPSVVGGRAGFTPTGTAREFIDLTQVLIDTGPLSQQEAMARLCPPGDGPVPGHHRLCNFVDGATSTRYMTGQAISDSPDTYGTSDGGPDLSALAYCSTLHSLPGRVFAVPAPQGESRLILTSSPTHLSRASTVGRVEEQPRGTLSSLD